MAKQGQSQTPNFTGSSASSTGAVRLGSVTIGSGVGVGSNSGLVLLAAGVAIYLIWQARKK